LTADVHLLADETKSSVAAVCRVLGVPRSTVYSHRNRKPSQRAKETAALDVAIRAVHAENKGRYGSPRVHRALRRNGQHVGRKRVEKRMRALELVGRRPKRFRRTTEADPKHVPAPNILARRFNWARPDQAWVGDITYIWTLAGWVYLATMIDLCTRGIVGWAVSSHCDKDLALRALNAAVARRKPPRGLLHHTDRGSTYTAEDYRAKLREVGMIASMSRKGNCWDNAVAESTFATIKTELFGDGIPENIHAVQRMLFPYIEGFYNRRRLHSTLGYITPAEKELAVAEKKVA
jgi:putative transposase